MYWQKRFNREDRDKEIADAILEIRHKHKDYGYRRIWMLLRKQFPTINKKKVQRIVQKLSLQVKSYGRKGGKLNTYKGNVGKVAPNRIHRRFTTSVPHQKITTDTTEFKYFARDSKGDLKTMKVYLNPFLDMYNREIISYSISTHLTAKSVMDALEAAVKVTSDCRFRRTFHSDQGWAYQMNDYRKVLKENRIFQSMSRKGNCHDNAVMESFFGVMKQEMYYGHVYNSYEELKAAIERFIEYYNKERIKGGLGGKSPVEFRESEAA